MSKNFELMQRAGKLLEIEIPRPAESSAALADPMAPALSPGIVPAISPSLGPANVPRRQSSRAVGGWTTDEAAREEAYRLVQNVFMVQKAEPPRVIVFAGIDPGNGCSTVCAHVAEALHQNLRGSICIVEANFRTPSLPQLYGVANHFGLTDALRGEGPIRSFAKPVGKDNLYLLSCGSLAPDSNSLLNSNRLKNRFRDLRNEFDYVVVDAPPLARYSDAIALGKNADGFVLILEANATRREAAIQISEYLRASQVPVLGAVLNKRTFPIPEGLYRRL